MLNEITEQQHAGVWLYKAGNQTWHKYQPDLNLPVEIWYCEGDKSFNMK